MQAPRKMVNTRSALRKEMEAPTRAHSDTLVSQRLFVSPNEEKPTTSARSVKTEGQAKDLSNFKLPTEKDRKSKSNRSSSSAALAQKKKLELEAATAKARIQMELIDAKLEADLAAVEEKYSSLSSRSTNGSDGKDIEKWLDQSQRELEKHRACTDGATAGPARPPAEAGTDGPVQQLTAAAAAPPPGQAGTDGPILQLVSAMKELVTSTVAGNCEPLRHDSQL
ncbi:hypothetical protein JYU34_020055 [Plutella xylostella]|uniref:Uncharacterized protein n=1 Tax=Plutella xylostella TaxID=51655 RepID=A0ABQ7PVY5_PLUXY|nr:hypothetical protein JYU34_020055 [Plutella xylostella]